VPILNTEYFHVLICFEKRKGTKYTLLYITVCLIFTAICQNNKPGFRLFSCLLCFNLKGKEKSDCHK